MTQEPVRAPDSHSVDDLLDPVEWKRRVAEARARREQALAARHIGSADPPFAPDTGPEQASFAEPDRPEFLPASGRRLRAARRPILAAVFATGLAAGVALARLVPGAAPPGTAPPDPERAAAGPPSPPAEIAALPAGADPPDRIRMAARAAFPPAADPYPVTPTPRAPEPDAAEAPEPDLPQAAGAVDAAQLRALVEAARAGN